MKTITDKITQYELSYKYPLLSDRISLHKQFFSNQNYSSLFYIDIETTGFNRSSDQVYLLGLLSVMDDDTIELTQYLCEKESDEYSLLFSFNQRLTPDTLLIHFNGNSFDLPFLKARMSLYGINEKISGVTSFDFYPALRLFRKLLSTDNFQLKSLEKIACFQREDTYSGGDLIPIYKAYREGEQSLQSLLLNHNFDDLIGLFYLNGFNPLFHLLPEISPLRSVLNLTPLIWMITSEDISELHEGHVNVMSISDEELITSHAISVSNKNYSLSIKNNQFTATLPITSNSLKYFYDNYKDYYFLVEEDYAIHKLVADFVGAKFKRKATKETAYIKKEGIFVQCPLFDIKQLEIIKNLQVPIFKDNYNSNWCYLTKDDLLNNINLLLPWIIYNVFINN